MKATDLMIGDWVACKKWKEKPFQITRINDSGRFVYGKTANSTIAPLIAEELEPIPLTAEILEKNGFEYMYDEYGCWLFGKIELRERESYNGLFEVEINIAKETIYIHYVHELQHALRLCRINKNIEL